MSGNGRDSGEREGSDRQASRNGRSGNGQSGSSSNPNRTRPGGAFGPGGLIRPPLSDPNGAGRPSNPRSNGRGANAKSTIGSMYAPRSNGANGTNGSGDRQPRSSSSR